MDEACKKLMKFGLSKKKKSKVPTPKSRTSYQISQYSLALWKSNQMVLEGQVIVFSGIYYSRRTTNPCVIIKASHSSLVCILMMLRHFFDARFNNVH